jgi:hypothetical protein
MGKMVVAGRYAVFFMVNQIKHCIELSYGGIIIYIALLAQEPFSTKISFAPNVQ